MLQVVLPDVGCPASPSCPESNCTSASARGYATPVDAVHGALHAVIECHTFWSAASKLSNVIVWPSVTVGIFPLAARSPAPYSKLPIGTVDASGPDAALRVWKNMVGAFPPWLSFSARCPWVSTPFWSMVPVNGSVPPAPSAAHTTPRPIDSYHDARFVS